MDIAYDDTVAHWVSLETVQYVNFSSNPISYNFNMNPSLSFFSELEIKD